MDRGNRPGKAFGLRNNKIYMDLKDIIRENALPFLPAKALSRFQIVCRDWKLQISTPFFAHNQSLSCREVFSCIYQIPGEPPSFISADPISCGVPDPLLRFLPEPVYIRTSSNGLLCCQGQAGDKAYYICNPVTQQWKKLPKPNADHGHHPAIVLVFEPSLLNFEADYKLVCAFSSADFDDATEFEIYSSKEGSWKISGEICFAGLKIDPRSGIHSNGIVYWKGKGLLLFDLVKDRSQLLNQYVVGTLGTINGKLCLADLNGCYSLTRRLLENPHSNTMQMSSTSKMWKEEKRVTLDMRVLGEIVDPTVLVAHNNFMVIKNGGKLFSYDRETKELKALTTTSDCGSKMVCLPYVNNLASL